MNKAGEGEPFRSTLLKFASITGQSGITPPVRVVLLLREFGLHVLLLSVADGILC